jgi:hypothetical protein
MVAAALQCCLVYSTVGSQVQFIIAKRHPIRNSEFMKATTYEHSFFQEDSLKIKNNQPILQHTAKMEHVCACLKFSSNMVKRTCNSRGKKRFCFQQIL